MKAFTQDGEPRSGTSSDTALLAVCPANALDFCHRVLKPSLTCGDCSTALPLSPEFTVPSRGKICSSANWDDVVPVICQGWVMSFVTLPDNRRQILSFLLPGDILSSSLVFETTAGRSFEAITPASYRTFNRSDLKALLAKNPDLLEALSRTWTAERADADQLAVDLGRRNADQRLARLVLYLRGKLAKRGMMQDKAMEFPLRQHHIADATGLTPVHVSRVMTNFRRKGLIAINGRSLTVLDADELHSIANS